jgi:hypothetical protein
LVYVNDQLLTTIKAANDGSFSVIFVTLSTTLPGLYTVGIGAPTHAAAVAETDFIATATFTVDTAAAQQTTPVNGLRVTVPVTAVPDHRLYLPSIRR